MTEQYHRWYSPNLNTELEMLVFGDRGYPVILFPTTKGRFHQNKDFGLIDSARWFVEQGLVKIYCPDTIDAQSWYDKDIHPADRARNYTWYDRMLTDELVPWAQHETGVERVCMAGCSFGGYHAANFAFKHPEKVAHLFTMGGAFDIKMFTDGYYDDNIFYNNPVDFVPGSNNEWLWRMNIILGTSEHDMCKGYNEEMSRILAAKNINHWLDIRPFANHDWPIWREMFPHYLSNIK
ncbi:abhydrolase domain-containing 18 [Mucilaginibacter pallidiroseus]|uniref:Abhydrolase domain-containing 18 n=1 Tax=Mucilaginibacter pallidiroseus TaxID=2599295 RepID=A0A563UG69_9SPHI|nr:alpha/beta fold hydrolase [Mucilaginibacter pallidiroseus]TWR30341.1 abhydrolase domain-containing 18 [Mucilaginibacter pallidiroseus]